MEIVFSPGADDDVRAILDHGFDWWEDETTLAYVAGLTAAIGRLSAFPQLGRTEPGIPDRFRMIPSGRHRVFYRIDANRTGS